MSALLAGNRGSYVHSCGLQGGNHGSSDCCCGTLAAVGEGGRVAGRNRLVVGGGRLVVVGEVEDVVVVDPERISTVIRPTLAGPTAPRTAGAGVRIQDSRYEGKAGVPPAHQTHNESCWWIA